MKVPWYLMAKGKGGGGYKTASGPIVSVNDALAAPLRSLRIGIDPVQDLHGYDSPWPAGGGVNKFAIGDAVGLAVKNACYNLDVDIDAVNETIRIHGTPSWTASGSYSFRVIATVAGYWGTTPVDHDYTGYNAFTEIVSKSSNITRNPYLSVSSSATISISAFTVSDTNAVDITLRLSLNPTSTPTEWTPYSNICPISGWSAANVWVKPTYDPTANPTATLQLGDTYYGGTLDVTNGVLTVDRANIASYNGEALPGEWISDRDVYAPGTTPTIGAQVVYTLATPITVSLTPQEISTLQGTNNLWADTGDVTVEYLSTGGADPNLMKLAVAFMGRK